MQTLDIITVNLWNIIISLCNLLILYLLFKKFLYAPVRKIMAARQDEIDARYMAADTAEMRANAHQQQWETKIEGAEAEAAGIIKQATDDAKAKSDNIITDAKVKAERIIKQAEVEADIEKRNVETGIKQELADVSAALAGKLLNREIDEADHRTLIDDFIREIGEDNDELE